MEQLSKKLEDKIERLWSGTDTTLHHVLYDQICRAAAYYWLGQNEDDFCLQSYSGETIVFGALNRLTYSPLHGFVPSPHHCTAKFLDRCRMIGPNPKSKV